MKRATGLLAATGALLILAACSSDVTVTPGSANEGVDAKATEVNEEETEDAGTVNTTSAKFGEVAEWDVPGLEVTIDEGEVAPMGEYAAADTCTTGDDVQYFDIKVTNNSGATYSTPDSAGIDAIADDGSGTDTMADQVFDDDTSSWYEMPPLRDGKSAETTIGYCAVDSPAFAIMVDPSIYDGKQFDSLDIVTFTTDGEDIV